MSVCLEMQHTKDMNKRTIEQQNIGTFEFCFENLTNRLKILLKVLLLN